jgi:hypothetical protein
MPRLPKVNSDDFWMRCAMIRYDLVLIPAADDLSFLPCDSAVACLD